MKIRTISYEKISWDLANFSFSKYESYLDRRGKYYGCKDSANIKQLGVKSWKDTFWQIGWDKIFNF